MISYEIQAALARQRRSDLLAEAEAAGRARRARAAHGGQVVLSDGSAVLIRPVSGADAPLLADGFARLSARSRWMRFLAAKKVLSPAELRYFTDVDHHDHEALGALDGDGQGVGIARYIRYAHDEQAADAAVTIVDDWQGRGLGTELVARLAGRARSEGIRRFTALVAAENTAVTGLLRKVGAEITGRGPGTVEYQLSLGDAGVQGGTPRASRRSALLPVTRWSVQLTERFLAMAAATGSCWTGGC